MQSLPDGTVQRFELAQFGSSSNCCHQKANGILSEDAEENKKVKRRKKNAQVAQESVDEEEEDDFSVLSEVGPNDDEDSGEEKDVNVVNEE